MGGLPLSQIPGSAPRPVNQKQESLYRQQWTATLTDHAHINLHKLVSCLRCTAARWLTSLQAMACSITN